MTSKAKPLIQVSKQAIAAVQREIFGQLPAGHGRTGHQFLKKAHRGEIIARYYPESIESSARKVRWIGLPISRTPAEFISLRVFVMMLLDLIWPILSLLLLLLPLVRSFFLHTKQVIPGYKSELEERRAEKLQILRRRGKGPPKKGSGKRSKKK